MFEPQWECVSCFFSVKSLATRVLDLWNVCRFSNHLSLTSSIVLYWKPLPAAFCYFSCATAHFPHTVHRIQFNTFKLQTNVGIRMNSVETVDGKCWNFLPLNVKKKTWIVFVCANKKAVNFCMRLNKLYIFLFPNQLRKVFQSWMLLVRLRLTKRIWMQWRRGKSSV